ncbi:MAG: metallophosphoesterase [Coriobacteriia bacterium]|nr:metallophosphoesterase [Coriobacteriia bacterium]
MKKKLRFRSIALIIVAVLIVAGVGYTAISSYLDSRPKLQYTFNTAPVKDLVSYPDSKFAVISDLHYYDDSLGTTGSAFEEVLGSDRKLLRETASLLSLAIDDILTKDVEFVLITGDLTKDGELVNHTAVSWQLSRLTEKGIAVYVVPGNHDINNPDAFKFEGDKSISVASVSRGEFAEIYKDYGYGDALYKDPSSLSYVAEPVEGLWLLAIDATRSNENKPGEEPVVGGKLTQAQEKWIEDVLGKAQASGKTVVCMMHHGVVEHWKGQGKLHPDYLVEDYPYVGKLLASYGVRLVFTGHYHAQDIARADYGDSGFIYDVETGSLATAPCPVRYCAISKGTVEIVSTDMVARLKPGTDFTAEAAAFVRKTIMTEAVSVLRGYRVSEADSSYIADYVASAFMAHYNGDEKTEAMPAFDSGKLSLWGKIIYSQERYVIEGLWHDLSPADNTVTLSLGAR